MTGLDALRTDLGADGLITDRDVLDAHRQDRALTDAGWPLALVRPRTTEDVQAVLRWAYGHRHPGRHQGAGTGLSGAAAAVDGCLVLSTVRMRDLRIDADDLVAVVQPGVVNAELKAAAREQGLTYPPDPSSYEESTIGGNIATNAGRALLRQVRRHARLRARPRGGARRWAAAAAARADGEGRRRL